ncbi:MAG: hypothetical protein FJ102_18070 [Deltaproteobacteria bacterium]|nr:hypothetical protein [Deltaproteobacteria bacterium]
MWQKLVVALSGAMVAWAAQPEADRTRHERQIDTALLFLPRGDTMRVAASGFHEPLASLLWVRAVITFGERYDTDASEEWREWLAGAVLAVNTLDPRWRTAYHYGGGLLRSVGAIDAASAVFERCSEAVPTDGWCPFSRGMNAYLYEKDRELAVKWMHMAAERPGAPGWWSAAAAGMVSESGAREGALAYIDAQLAEAATEAEIHYLERQKRRILHDQVVDQWAEACRQHYRDTGARLPAPEALLGLGFALPENPRGDAWVVGRDGVVRSERAEVERRGEAVGDERALVVAPR